MGRACHNPGMDEISTPPAPGVRPLLEALARTRAPWVRVWSVTVDGRRYWLKRRGGVGGGWRTFRSRVGRLFQGWLCRGLPQAAVAEPAPGEPERLARYRREGLPVPALLAVSPRLMLLAHAGEPLPACLAQTNDAGLRQRLIDAALQALIDWHRRGHWHGQAQLRHLCLHEGRLQRLDFAAPGGLPLAWLQLRDFAQFIMTAAPHQSPTERVQAASRWFADVARPETSMLAQRLLRWVWRARGLGLSRLVPALHRRLTALAEALHRLTLHGERRGELPLPRLEAPRSRWRAALLAVSLLLVSDDLYEFAHRYDYDETPVPVEVLEAVGELEV